MCNGSVMSGRVKVCKARDGRLIGAAGKSSYCDAFRKWAMTEKGRPPKMETDSCGIIIGTDGKVRIFDSDEGAGCYELSPPYFAVGSGQDYAMGAMHYGAGAEAAIRAAIAHDKGTNGEVLVLRR
jgi:hypothetical protein